MAVAVHMGGTGTTTGPSASPAVTHPHAHPSAVLSNVCSWRNQTSSLSCQVAARRKMQADGKSPPTLVPVPQHNPLLLGLTPTRYLLKELRGIRAADLEEALHALPFAAARELLRYLLHWLRKGLVPELCCKCVLFLVKLHNNQVRVCVCLCDVLRTGPGVLACCTSLS